MKKIVLGALALLSMNAFGQNVNIPDANFKAYLVGNTAINTSGDNEIQISEASTYTGSILANGQGISDLTGIEAFTGITELNCSYNQITEIDLSSNSALRVLYCTNNAPLESLNLANGNNGNNSASDLWRVYAATNNTNLTCIQHDVGFDPTNAPQWVKPAGANWSTNCGGSTCTNIVNIPDANFKAALLDHGVGITTAGVSVIDTDGDGEICQTEAQAYNGSINVFNKNISDLTGIEAFTAISLLNSNNNQLTTLDLSSNNSLTQFYCTNNLLTYLNVANGNNNNMTDMWAQGNNLSCIQHDSGFNPSSISNWVKDVSTSWSDNCPPVSSCNNIVNIPDANFKNALLAHGVSGPVNGVSSITGVGISVIDTDGDGEICESEALAYTGTINVSSQNISDMTGIEAFINLIKLNCTYNSFSNLNVSSNTALQMLNCSFNNSLTSLDVSANTDLQELFCAENALTSLNVANGSNGVSSPNLYYVVTTTNPNLSCIQHDSGFDPTSTSNWQKDATASWSDNCSGSSSGINENNISFSIIPNPTSGMLTIETDVEINSVEVYSMTGKKIQSSKEKTIDLSEVRTGVYFVKVITDNGSLTKRVVKR